MKTNTRMRTQISLACLFGLSMLQAQIVLIDDGEIGNPTALNPDVSTSGSWEYRTESQHGGTWENSGSRFSGNNGDTITYTSSLPTSGIWGMEIWVTDTLNENNSSVSFTTSSGPQSPTIEQGDMGSGSRGQWLSLGLYDFDSGSNSYTLTSGGTNQSSDAVRWVNFSNNVSDLTPVVIGTKGGISADYYNQTGTGWFESSTGPNQSLGVYGNASMFTDTSGDIATFSAPIQAFQYDVLITWNESGNRSDNTLYEVIDANNVTHQFRINQQLNPGGDSFLGNNWYSLGQFNLDENSIVRIVADEDAVSSGLVNADGIQFVAIPEPGTLMLVGIALGSLMLFRRRK